MLTKKRRIGGRPKPKYIRNTQYKKKPKTARANKRTQRRTSVRNFGNRLKSAFTQIPNIPVLLGKPKNSSNKNILLGPDGDHIAWTVSHRNAAAEVLKEKYN